MTLSSLNGHFNRQLPCDLLVASAGLTPVTGPLTLAEAKLAYDSHTGFFLPRTLPAWLFAAGRMLGLNDFETVSASGRLAGLRAAGRCGADTAAPVRDCMSELEALPGPARGCKFVSAPRSGRKTFICFDEDTTLKNVDQAMDMGFDVPELIKRFTSAGTGPGQGGIPGHNLALYVGQSGSSPDSEPRPTLTRPPLVPTLMATYAGSAHAMTKRTPLHDLQVAEGGRMETVGDWRRARRFSDDARCREEIENVRANVGLLDASTLGKFRIFGPDALKAMQRVYVSDMSRMHPGKARYSAMCNDDGCLTDDGVIVQTGENDYYFTTSTGRAGVTAEWIRYHTRFDGWDFSIVNLTDAYGVINIAGPNARAVLSRVTRAAVDNQAFPYMGYREFKVGGVPGARPAPGLRRRALLRAARALLVDAQRVGAACWRPAASSASATSGSRPRTRCGWTRRTSSSARSPSSARPCTIWVWASSGTDTSPRPKPWATAALRHTENQPGRLKLVGFKMENANAAPPKDGSPIVDRRIRGYVCTARLSVALKEVVGLALVDDELAGLDSRLAIYEDGCQGNLIYAKVVKKPFYDPQGERLRS